MRITWSSINPPSGSSMSLWLVRKDTGAVQAVIVAGLAPNGIYNWTLPSTSSTCNTNASNVCSNDLVSQQQYTVEAVLYTPSNAYVGDGISPVSPVAPVYGNSGLGGVFTIQ